MDRRVRWAILGGLVVLFCVSGPFLVMYSMGYRFRLGSEEGKSSWRLEERGLILLESNPPGATVSIDGSLTKLKTPVSIYRPAPSECTIALQLDGYQPWSRTFQVTPQIVSRAEKIILPPATIEAQLVTSAPITCFALSADGKFLACGIGSTTPCLWIKETTSNEEPIKIFPHGQQHSFAPNGSISKIEIATGNRAALVTTKVGDTPEQTFWVSLREPHEFVKLNDIIAGGEMFKINPRAPHQVFVVAGGRLHRVDVKERAIKSDISRNVETIEIGDDGLWLLKNGDRVIYARPFNSNDPADDKALLEHDDSLDVAKTNNRQLIVDGSRNVAILAAGSGALVRNDSKKLATLFKSTHAVAFSPNHLFVALADDHSIQILDAFPIRSALFERSAEPQKEMLAPYRVADGKPITQIFWWDDSAHLLVRRGKTLELIETDAPLGGHRHVLLDNLPEDSPLGFDAKEATIYFTQRAAANTGEMLLFSARLRPSSKGMLDWLIRPKPPASSATLSEP